jgi:hypothetical protein
MELCAVLLIQREEESNGIRRAKLEKGTLHKFAPLRIAAMMGTPDFWARFVLASLATWRIAHLFVSEDGPADVITRVRARLGDSVFGKLMDCFGCFSLWIGIPFAFFVSRGIVDLILTWLALSGAAFLLERATAAPLIIERSSEDMKGD